MPVRGTGLWLGAIAVVLVVAAGVYWFVLRNDGSVEERAFHEAFDKAMREECISKAITTATQLGRKGPELEAELARRCDCALKIVQPMSQADKLALGSDRGKQAEVMGEIVKRCGG